MSSQKIDPFLTIANYLLKTGTSLYDPDLLSGYDSASDTWDIILKSTGNESLFQQISLPYILKLDQGYYLARISYDKIEAVAQKLQTIYIEGSSRFYYEQSLSLGQGQSPLLGSDIGPLITAPYNLSGKGVVVAVIDSGIDFSHPAFLNEDKSTRFLLYWDQNLPRQNDDLPYGQVFTETQINQFLSGERSYPRTLDPSGHGTAVAGIITSIAPNAKLIGISLGNFKGSSTIFQEPQTSQIMAAVNFVYEQVLQISTKGSIPLSSLVINLSLGNSLGSHRGNSLLESYLSSVSSRFPSIILAGTGNDGDLGRHASVLLSSEPKRVLFNVDDRQPGFAISVWKSYADEVDIYLQSPAGDLLLLTQKPLLFQVDRLFNTMIQTYYAMPSPFLLEQLLWFSMIPVNNYVDSGTWELVFVPKSLREGTIELWMPGGDLLLTATRFLSPKLTATFTIPSTTQGVISVGAYDYGRQSLAPFSGRGFDPYGGKPDFVAPGVNISAPIASNRFRPFDHPNAYGAFTGTSFSTPIAAGVCALYMEWGITQKKDPFLYGEKLKAVLRKNAKPLDSSLLLPDSSEGFGKLCAFPLPS